jgi:hypothetical protein
VRFVHFLIAFAALAVLRTGLAVGVFESNPAVSMLGLFIAWQVFPMVTDPLFSTLLWIVLPGETYS